MYALIKFIPPNKPPYEEWKKFNANSPTEALVHLETFIEGYCHGWQDLCEGLEEGPKPPVLLEIRRTLPRNRKGK